MYKAIIYDCDGTLLDSKNVTIETYEYMIGRKLTEGEMEKVFHQTQIESFKMFNLNIEEGNLKRIENMYKEIDDSIKPFDGVMNLLRAVKKLGIHQAMATNRNAEAAEMALNGYGLQKYIETVVHADMVLNPKPSGEMLLKYMDMMKLEKDEVLFVGNAITDHMAAIDAGIDFCYCSWGTVEYLEKSAIILDRPEELLKYVKEDVYGKNLCAQGI